MKKDRIEAEVILRPGDPSQTIEQPIRAASVRKLEPAEETIERVTNKLRELGFEVVAQGSGSISIAGSKALFSRHFKLDEKKNPESETLFVPEEIKDGVEGIYVQTPATYFKN